MYLMYFYISPAMQKRPSPSNPTGIPCCPSPPLVWACQVLGVSLGIFLSLAVCPSPLFFVLPTCCHLGCSPLCVCYAVSFVRSGRCRPSYNLVSVAYVHPLKCCFGGGVVWSVVVATCTSSARTNNCFGMSPTASAMMLRTEENQQSAS